jgi:two-component system, LytTR family, sensor kinase
MKRQTQTRYWICQIGGWGLLSALTIFLIYNYGSDDLFKIELKRNLFLYSVLSAFIGLLISTHLLRLVLKKMNWLSFTPPKIFSMFLIGVTITTFLAYYGTEFLEKIPGNTFEKYEINERKEKAIAMEKDMNVAATDYYLYEQNNILDSLKYKSFLKIKKTTSWYRDKNNKWQFEEQRKGKLFGGLFNNFILISLWLLVYVVIHYVEKNRNNQLDKLRLEGVVKSLELKTIKSHINPHFIFNALNSIRALVDENPARARTAITELSNILRSSLQAEKLETVPLEQELDIVQDYLALEHMRFEERLKIEMHIDPETLSQPIPPMMLQNLVENAIKHGISKDVNGGIVIIRSYFKDNQHELVVQNTGNLQALKKGTSGGFGLRSTQDRLNLLYHNKALFEIEEKNGNIVQSKIIMPISHSTQIA